MNEAPWEELYEALRNARGQATELDQVPDADEYPCAQCKRLIGSSGRWYSDGAGSLVPYCKTCAEIEFPVL